VSYEIEAADLSRIRNDTDEEIILGEPGLVVDDTLGLHAQVRLYEVHRSLDDPLDIRLVFQTRKRAIEDTVTDVLERIDDYDGPTEELPADKVNFPDGGTLDDWVGDDDQIDGGEIQDGTIDRLELARVIERTATSPQEYTVELLDPVTRAPTTVQETGCYTADNSSDLIATYTEVLVLIRGTEAQAAGEHNVIVQGGGSGTNYYITAPALTFTGTGF
jgi:hypothetical protein